VILGCGIDILETRRVEQEHTRGEWLPEEGIFTPEEVTRCNTSRNPARRFAACFAAKEAALKALGAQVDDLAIFREAEVMFGPGAECSIILHGRLRSASERRGVRSIRLSITQSANQTCAMVLLEA